MPFDGGTGRSVEELMKTPEALLATPAVFRGWLAAQPPGSVVGTARSSLMCAIAEFLLQMTGEAWTVSGSTGAVPLAPGPLVDGTVATREILPYPSLPAWAIGFIRGHDRLDEGDGPVCLVTARAALAVLDKVEAGLGGASLG